MATLKSNALVKVLVPAVLLGAVGVGMRACTSGTPEQTATQQVPHGKRRLDAVLRSRQRHVHHVRLFRWHGQNPAGTVGQDRQQRQ